MEHLENAALRIFSVPAILAALEEQLAALDAIGAHIPAAHLDAAIQQLRLEQARR